MSPLRAGWSRWQAVLGLALLPPLLAAPLRVILLLPVSWANIAGLLAALACAWFIRPWLAAPAERPDSRWFLRVLPLCLGAGSILLLYSRAFGGLTEIVGADGGNHAAYVREFRDLPGSYNGFVSMYCAWDGVASLFRLDWFWSFVVVFYLVVAGVAVLPTVPALQTLHRYQRTQPRAWWWGAATVAVASILAQLLVVLPLEHYFQSEGWWPQLFGLVPMLLLWCLDATLRVRWQRILVWIAGVALVRYTYGLNFGEVLLALGVVLVVESRGRMLWAAAAAAAACGYGVWLVWLQIRPLLDNFGWIIPYPLPTTLAAGWLAVVTLAVAAWGHRAASRGSGLVRAVRVPLLFGGFGTLITTLMRASGPGQLYYLLKYPFQNVILLALGLVAALGAVVATLASRWQGRSRRDLVWGGSVLAGAVAAGWLWFSAFSPYHAGFVERIDGNPPWQVLRPLADLGAWKRIESTLRNEKRKFGGYLVSFGPMSNFMNSAMGVADGQRFYFEGQPPRTSPGYCVFWDESKKSIWTDWDERFPQRPYVKKLSVRIDKQCVEYFAHWDKSERRRLCHFCD